MSEDIIKVKLGVGKSTEWFIVKIVGRITGPDYREFKHLDGYDPVLGTNGMARLNITVRNLKWLDAHGFTSEEQEDMISHIDVVLDAGLVVRK